MLRHARMAAMRKLHRSVVWSGEGPVWAVHVGRGEIVWQDRCDAANGSKEPTLAVAARLTNGWYLGVVESALTLPRDRRLFVPKIGS
jgi:hypothetical protein